MFSGLELGNFFSSLQISRYKHSFSVKTLLRANRCTGKSRQTTSDRSVSNAEDPLYDSHKQLASSRKDGVKDIHKSMQWVDILKE